MKKITTRVFLMLAFASILFAFNTDNEKSLPSLKMVDLNGKTIDIAEYGKNNKITVISFWATWCKPCIKELQAINDNFEDWQEDVDFEVVAISIDDARTKAKVKPTVSAFDWPFDVLIDEKGESKRSFNYQTPPYLVVVDKNGKIAYKHSGYLVGDEDELFEKLEEISAK